MEEETKLETPEEKAHRKERERFMRQAITQAKKAEKLMEVPIGCVIVYEGKVIARGYNRRNTDKNTLSHAELNAIRKASKKLGDWRLEGDGFFRFDQVVAQITEFRRKGKSIDLQSAFWRGIFGIWVAAAPIRPALKRLCEAVSRVI